VAREHVADCTECGGPLYAGDQAFPVESPVMFFDDKRGEVHPRIEYGFKHIPGECVAGGKPASMLRKV